MSEGERCHPPFIYVILIGTVVLEIGSVRTKKGSSGVSKSKRSILLLAAPDILGYNAGRQGLRDMATTGRSRVHPVSSGMDRSNVHFLKDCQEYDDDAACGGLQKQFPPLLSPPSDTSR